jgi:hypothetical protein
MSAAAAYDTIQHARATGRRVEYRLSRASDDSRSDALEQLSHAERELLEALEQVRRAIALASESAS